MADSDEHRVRDRGPVRIDSQTLLPLALVVVLLGGGVQYGRQSERLDSVVRELTQVQAKLTELTLAIAKLNVPTTAGR